MGKVQIKTVYPSLKSKYIVEQAYIYLENITEQTKHSFSPGQEYEIISEDYHVGFAYYGKDTVLYAVTEEGKLYVEGIISVLYYGESVVQDQEVEDQVKPVKKKRKNEK